MSVTKTTLFPPPREYSQKYQFSLQNLLPFNAVDTSAGPVAVALPPAGNISGTGQNNQNQEIIYKKTSADANVFTVTGGAEGPQTLTNQYDTIRFKSDGTNWWVTGVLP